MMAQPITTAFTAAQPRQPRLLDRVCADLSDCLRRIRQLHELDLTRGFGSVWLPEALERKLPNASRKWCWQWVFPSAVLSVDPRTGIKRRHDAHEGSVSRAITQAVRRAGLSKRERPATVFATAAQCTCWKTAMISARSRNSWATKTFARQLFTPAF
jgi:hypothetical protein